MRRRRRHTASASRRTEAITNGPSPFVIEPDNQEPDDDFVTVPSAALAEQMVGSAMCEYLRLSLGGTERVEEREFVRIKDCFERAIIMAQSDERTCRILEANALAKLEAEFSQADIRTSALNQMRLIWDRCWLAIESLSPAAQVKFGLFVEELRSDCRNLALLHRNNYHELQAAMRSLGGRYKPRLLCWGPEIARAFQEYIDALGTREGMGAAQYLDEMIAIDRIRHSAAMIRLLYSQVLAKQGGNENLQLARKNLRESVQDSLTTEILVDGFARSDAADGIVFN